MLKKQYLIVVFLVCVFFYFSPVFASETLTMDGIVKAAIDANPTLAAAEFSADAARARPPQAGTPPDPEFMLEFYQVPIDTMDVKQGTIEYMVEQQVPFPSKLVYGYKAEKREAEAKAHTTSATQNEIISQVKKVYLDIWRLQEEERINRQALNVYSANKARAETAYSALESPISDPVRASVDLGEIEGRLVLLEQEKQEMLAALSSIIARDISESDIFSPPPSESDVGDLAKLIEKASFEKPEVKEADKMLEAGRFRKSFAKQQYIPDLLFRFSYMDMPGNMQNAWTGRVGLSIPLWSLSKQRFQVREADANLSRARSMKMAAELASAKEVKSAYARLVAAKKMVDIYSKKVVPRAEILLSSSEETYKSKKGDFLNVVESIRTLTDSRLMLVKAKADVAKARADLDRAVGVSIPKEDR